MGRVEGSRQPNERLSRRRFLQLAGGTAAFSALAPSITRAATIPAHRRTRTLKDVEHIVVLMQENRSFDHYFGTMRGVRGFGDPRPVILPSGRTVFEQPNVPVADLILGKPYLSDTQVLPYHPEADDLGMQFLGGTPHDWDTTHIAWNLGRYDGWIPAKSTLTMAHMVRDDIPFHFALADAFTSCDAYHCSVMGPTDPNRYYMFTGYTGNDGQGGGPDLSNGEVGYSWGTYAERLERAGVSWKVYQDAGHGLDAAGGWGWADDPYIGNYGDNSLLYFNNYRNAKPGEPLYEKARTGTDARNGESFFHILEADVRDDTLPQISWIAAPEAFSEHGNWPTNYGAWYISKVLDALTSNPDVWSKTALLITYDENDGYFDHVVPPFPPPTPLQGASTVEYDHEIRLPGEGLAVLPGPYGLGQRVPMIVVSPWSKGGYVCSQTFDHTSIIQFMEARFGVHEPNISAWRRTVSGDLTSAFNFHDPDPRDVELPDTSGYRPPDDVRHPNYVPAPPAEQALPKQEPGLRPARPLPYNLVADACVETPLDVRIDFANHGTAGASFLVTSAILEIVPQTYTVEAGKSLSGRWVVAAGYDLSVHGPNGFFRQYAGIGLPGPEVTATEDGATGTVRLVLSNRGLLPVSLTVTDGYGQESAATYTVIPGQTIEHLADPRASNHWYDLSVKSNLDSHYQRRFAGHVETGAVSTSDPAIRTS